MAEVKFYDLGFTLRIVNLHGDKIDVAGKVLARSDLVDPHTSQVAKFGWVKDIDRGPTQEEIDRSIRLGLIESGDVPNVGAPSEAAEEDDSPPQALPEGWGDYTKAELVELADSLDLPTDGTKAELTERLEVYSRSVEAQG